MGFTVADQFCVADPETGQWEHAFWVEDQSAYADNERYQMRLCLYVAEVGEWYPVPNYSGDIAAAFIVIEWLRKIGLSFAYEDRTLDGSGDEQHLCTFTNGDGMEWDSFEESFPRAVCVAALDVFSTGHYSVSQNNSNKTSGK